MNFSNILLALVIVFFIVHLILAVREGRSRKGQICLVSKQTGEVIPLDSVTMSELVKSEIQLDFTHTAKIIFAEVADSFAKGRLSHIKNYLNEKVFPVFEQAISEREHLKQKAEFVLIGFKEVKLISDTPDKKVVAFTTEQINLLRDEKNQVIEGDPLYVATVTEHWTFEKKSENSWVVSSIKNMEGHFA